jgi:hypothetical protein
VSTRGCFFATSTGPTTTPPPTAHLVEELGVDEDALLQRLLHLQELVVEARDVHVQLLRHLGQALVLEALGAVLSSTQDNTTYGQRTQA